MSAADRIAAVAGALLGLYMGAIVLICLLRPGR